MERQQIWSLRSSDVATCVEICIVVLFRAAAPKTFIPNKTAAYNSPNTHNHPSPLHKITNIHVYTIHVYTIHYTLYIVYTCIYYTCIYYTCIYYTCIYYTCIYYTCIYRKPSDYKTKLFNSHTKALLTNSS